MDNHNGCIGGVNKRSVRVLRVLTASLSLCRGAAALVRSSSRGPERAGQNGAGIAAEAAGSRQPHAVSPMLDSSADSGTWTD